MNSNILRNTKFNLTFFLSASVVPLLVTGPFLPSLLKKKFVNFSLHFEPERTTYPDVGCFHNQFLAIQKSLINLKNKYINFY